MARFVKKNNERSEAIELIKLMDSIAKRNTWRIKSVGGESTLNTGNKRMFPDVFVYGDTSRIQILQGWEIKMPDVPITDSVFIHDAQRKADVLGVNSCVIWNFSFGVLYIKSDDTWSKTKKWSSTNHIRTRADVDTYKSDWEALISEILGELNGFFISGELHPARIENIVIDTVFTEIIERNKATTAEHLKNAGVRKTAITAYITRWWETVKSEYKFDENDKFSAYSKFILLNWINKFTFANMIKNNHNPASAVETIDEDIKPDEALKVFTEITEKCDFFNIFKTIKHSDILPVSTWADLTDYNAFLYENGFSQISQTVLQSVLENSVNQFKRNVNGVFTTPQKLAEILVRAGIDDLAAPAIDVCCGTGTIAKEVLALKIPAIGIENAFNTTYASDKSAFALQVSNIAMTRAEAINLPSLLFQSNAFNLCENKEVQITDPQNGGIKTYRLPKWGSVVSNLPFVAFDQEGREESDFINSTIKRIRAESNISLSERSDLYQFILLHIHGLLDENASVAVITSNSWLGTIAGQDFFHTLNCYYSVDSVIASGNGKWFNNADVVAVMLFLKKKPFQKAVDKAHKVNFALIQKRLSELSSDDIERIADSIKLQDTDLPELLSFRSYTLKQIDEFLKMNIALNSFLYDVDWLSEINDLLCPVTDLFNVFRGMKTAQDEIYYLKNTSDVDSEYIGRIFKSAKSAKGLTAKPDTYSFVCDKTIEELTELGHKKTLAWINRFKSNLNKSVQNKDTFWKNLSGNRLSGSEHIQLFTGMNPEQRIFYGLIEEPAQINQRAIGFKPTSDSVNLALCHALLNSVIGVFYTEATGFPKGLGALDNCSVNVSRMLMLDPRKLSDNDIDRITEAFKPLLERDILTTLEEYQREDRLAFERVVADCFGYSEQFERIKRSVLEMQKVRLSVKK
ncbi:MAG: hypothetical protein FWF76_01400 [Oscillospiraceae bacterium]|nr:hypothetical protein [Oscillospiraceae bacterium]